MSDEGASKSWWQTLPGIITGIAAIVTAVSGLVVAVQQTGWFASSIKEATKMPVSVSASVGSSGVSAQNATTAAPSSLDRGAHAVELPKLREYKLGATSYTLLKADVSPQTTESDALKIRVRMTNNDRYDQNFWDRSFRLVVDGVPKAPESDLNELVSAQSAKDGEVLFTIPHGSAGAKLKISYADKSTEIALDLSAR